MIQYDPALEAVLRAALREDIGQKDLTSELIPKTHSSKGDALFKEDGLLCGVQIAEKIFRLCDEDIRFLPAAKDGERIEKGRVVFYIEGPTRSILAAERTALNFLARMSGVATLTRKFVDAVTGTRSAILDTRKTMPTLRSFDRYAVKTGGGQNHRTGLYDGILIKDNHLRVLKPKRFDELYRSVRAKAPKGISIGLEVKSPDEAEKAMGVGFDYLLLDNFSPEEVRETVKHRTRLISNQALEVSGNVSLNNVRDYAETGVDRISIGALTHSAKAIDISLNLI